MKTATDNHANKRELIASIKTTKDTLSQLKAFKLRLKAERSEAGKHGNHKITKFSKKQRNGLIKLLHNIHNAFTIFITLNVEDTFKDYYKLSGHKKSLRKAMERLFKKKKWSNCTPFFVWKLEPKSKSNYQPHYHYAGSLGDNATKQQYKDFKRFITKKWKSITNQDDTVYSTLVKVKKVKNVFIKGEMDKDVEKNLREDKGNSEAYSFWKTSGSRRYGVVFEKNITYGNIQSKKISDKTYTAFIKQCMKIQSERISKLKEQELSLKRRKRYIRRLGKLNDNFMAYLTDEEMKTLVSIIRDRD